MDEKMREAFGAWVFEQGRYLSAKEIIEWALDYLRTQQEPVAYVGQDYHIVTLVHIERGVDLYAQPILSAHSIKEGQS